MTTENENTEINNYMFPACSYMLGLGGKTEDNSIIAFENVLKEENKCTRGLLVIKLSEDQNSTDQEAMLITPKEYDDGRPGVQLSDKLVSFEDTYVTVEGNNFHYKNMELACENDICLLITKDEKKEILKLNNQVIEFLKMNLIAQTIKIVIVDKKLCLSHVSIRNVTPLNAYVNWTHELIFENNVEFILGEPDIDFDDDSEKSKWISENSYLVKETKKYPLSTCSLSQLNDKIYLVIKSEDKDDILLGYIIPSSENKSDEDEKNKDNLHTIKEENSNEENVNEINEVVNQ